MKFVTPFDFVGHSWFVWLILAVVCSILAARQWEKRGAKLARWCKNDDYSDTAAVDALTSGIGWAVFFSTAAIGFYVFTFCGLLYQLLAWVDRQNLL